MVFRSGRIFHSLKSKLSNRSHLDLQLFFIRIASVSTAVLTVGTIIYWKFRKLDKTGLPDEKSESQSRSNSNPDHHHQHHHYVPKEIPKLGKSKLDREQSEGAQDLNSDFDPESERPQLNFCQTYHVLSTDDVVSCGGPWDFNWDRQSPEGSLDENEREEAVTNQHQPEQRNSGRPTATRHLLLIRHGIFVQSDGDDKLRVLTNLGREQAEMTGRYLRDLQWELSGMVSSTLQRAVETADIIHTYLPHLELTRDPLLCEGRPIVPVPTLNWIPPYKYFQEGARIEAAFRKYFHRADPTQEHDSVQVIVCHANVIRYFICRALQFPPEGWLRIALPHASLTHITLFPTGEVAVSAVGLTGHMTPTKVTTSSRGRPD